MIIDSHVHIGTFVKTSMPKEMVLESMDKYNIDFSIVSNGSGCEVDHDQLPIPLKEQRTQSDINREMIEFARANSNKIGALLWAKPATEVCDDEFEQMIKENPDIVYGIKVHPYHSKTAFNSEKVQAYIRLAEKYGLCVLSHTACDCDSDPKLVYEMAKKYPKVKFIMAHMGLGTDNQEAIRLISKLPNLYGDTAWVKAEIVEQAIRECGSDKILFGTDNPINGLDTYDDDDFYNRYFVELKSRITEEEFEKLTYKNAINVFGIKKYK